MTIGAPVRYGKHSTAPNGTVCETCGSTKPLPVNDHCHEHGWVRGIVCRRCNVLMSFVDKRFTPRVDAPLLAALVALRNRCPECDNLSVSDFGPALEVAISVRLPGELYESLRRDAFETRRSINSIIIDAIKPPETIGEPS